MSFLFLFSVLFSAFSLVFLPVCLLTFYHPRPFFSQLISHFPLTFPLSSLPPSTLLPSQLSLSHTPLSPLRIPPYPLPFSLSPFFISPLLNFGQYLLNLSIPLLQFSLSFPSSSPMPPTLLKIILLLPSSPFPFFPLTHPLLFS